MVAAPTRTAVVQVMHSHQVSRRRRRLRSGFHQGEFFLQGRDQGVESSMALSVRCWMKVAKLRRLATELAGPGFPGEKTVLAKLDQSHVEKSRRGT